MESNWVRAAVDSMKWVLDERPNHVKQLHNEQRTKCKWTENEVLNLTSIHLLGFSNHGNVLTKVLSSDEEKLKYYLFCLS